MHECHRPRAQLSRGKLVEIIQEGKNGSCNIELLAIAIAYCMNGHTLAFQVRHDVHTRFDGTADRFYPTRVATVLRAVSLSTSGDPMGGKADQSFSCTNPAGSLCR